MTKTISHHFFSTRLWHWLTVVSLFCLLMSGLSIFNAHPRLYWGEAGHWKDPAWLSIRGNENQGALQIGSTRIDTTGVLGSWERPNGTISTRAFPHWSTIPSYYSLSDGRRWHFFFAWWLGISLAFFFIISLINGHFRKTLWMRKADWSPRAWGVSLAHHLHLYRIGIGKRPDHPEYLGVYNPVQKFTYKLVIFIAIPLVILTGLTMSPGINVAFPFLTDLMGGRQSARSIHFLCAGFLVLFFIAHMLMLLLNHPLKLLRTMTLGIKTKVAPANAAPNPNAAPDDGKGAE